MNNEIELVSEKKLTEYLNLFGSKDLLEKEKLQFLEIAKAYNLNPFKREIYMTAYGTGEYRQCSIITGYEVYIKRAERSGKLDGYSVVTEGNIPDMTATITIYRKDWTRPFIHTVEYSEYVQKKKDGTINKFWLEKPKTMLKKVATAQAFRLCFSNEFGGMPYTSEEMPQPDIILESIKKDFEENKNQVKEEHEVFTDEEKEKIDTEFPFKIPEKIISDDQVKRLKTIAVKKDQAKAKDILSKYGYVSSKEIRVKDYDEIIKEIELL